MAFDLSSEVLAGTRQLERRGLSPGGRFRWRTPWRRRSSRAIRSCRYTPGWRPQFSAGVVRQVQLIFAGQAHDLETGGTGQQFEAGAVRVQLRSGLRRGRHSTSSRWREQVSVGVGRAFRRRYVAVPGRVDERPFPGTLGSRPCRRSDVAARAVSWKSIPRCTLIEKLPIGWAAAASG